MVDRRAKQRDRMLLPTTNNHHFGLGYHPPDDDNHAGQNKSESAETKLHRLDETLHAKLAAPTSTHLLDGVFVNRLIIDHNDKQSALCLSAMCTCNVIVDLHSQSTSWLSTSRIHSLVAISSNTSAKQTLKNIGDEKSDTTASQISKSVVDSWLQADQLFSPVFVDPALRTCVEFYQDQLATIPDQVFAYGRSATNPYESISKMQFLNRAAIKAWECDVNWNIHQQSVSATSSPSSLGWYTHAVVASSSTSALSSSSSSVGDDKKKTHIKPLADSNKNSTVADDRFAGLDVVFADGASSVRGGLELAQESVMWPLIFNEHLVAIETLAPGGRMTCKLFNPWTPATALMLASISFFAFGGGDDTHQQQGPLLHFPLQSRPANCERFDMFTGFRGRAAICPSWMLSMQKLAAWLYAATHDEQGRLVHEQNPVRAVNRLRPNRHDWSLFAKALNHPFHHQQKPPHDSPTICTCPTDIAAKWLQFLNQMIPQLIWCNNQYARDQSIALRLLHECAAHWNDSFAKRPIYFVMPLSTPSSSSSVAVEAASAATIPCKNRTNEEEEDSKTKTKKKKQQQQPQNQERQQPQPAETLVQTCLDHWIRSITDSRGRSIDRWFLNNQCPYSFQCYWSKIAFHSSKQLYRRQQRQSQSNSSTASASTMETMTSSIIYTPASSVVSHIEPGKDEPPRHNNNDNSSNDDDDTTDDLDDHTPIETIIERIRDHLLWLVQSPQSSMRPTGTIIFLVTGSGSCSNKTWAIGVSIHPSSAAGHSHAISVHDPEDWSQLLCLPPATILPVQIVSAHNESQIALQLDIKRIPATTNLARYTSSHHSTFGDEHRDHDRCRAGDRILLVADVCGAPGGTIEYVSTRFKSPESMVFGISLRNQTDRWRIDRFGRFAPSSTIHIYYGQTTLAQEEEDTMELHGHRHPRQLSVGQANNQGDLTNPATRRGFAQFVLQQCIDILNGGHSLLPETLLVRALQHSRLMDAFAS
jgi:23S rRNA U2552 (ribose-2'-O)-methylase RlmE/FtsJ